MLTGISENLQDVSDSRKTAVINNELMRLNVDIATLQETRLADDPGALKEKDYTFYWQWKGSGEHREYGVGFAVRNSLLSMSEPGSNGSERLLTLRLNTTAGPVTLVSVYAPTMSATSDTKDEFYENLAAIISSVPNNEQLILLGDFNARVGANHDTWPSCIGQFGVGKMNENGQRLLELCTYHDLCIANSYFRTKPQHKVSRRDPRSKHWHQLDLIILRRASLKNVLHTRSYHSADCNTDHSLVCCVAGSGCNQKGSIAQRNRGTPVLMSAICHNQTSCHNSRRLLRENSVPHIPTTLPQRSGKFYETPCTAQPWPPSGKKPQRLTIGLTPSRRK